jgi:hypothetical protein
MSILSERNEIEIEIGARIQSENKCLYLRNYWDQDHCQKI